MEKRDNYAIQAQAARNRFLGYDQQRLIEKFHLKADDRYLYTTMLASPYRICRRTGDLERKVGDTWVSGNSFNETLTLFDVLCDSKEDRSLSGAWRSMRDFGLQFHTGLLERSKDPTAARFDREPALLRRGCEGLGGVPMPGADISYKIELCLGLPILLQFWHGDEEFSPRVRYLWDENAASYIRYETMWYAVNLLLERIDEFGRRDAL